MESEVELNLAERVTTVLETRLTRSDKNVVAIVRELSVPQELTQAKSTAVPMPTLKEMNDSALIARVVARERSAFAELVHRHLGLCIGLGRRVLGNDADAEDVAQETMLKLWQTSDALTIGTEGLRPWLARVTYNRAIDRLRARRPVDTLDAADDLAEAASQVRTLEDNDVKVRVEKALDRLPERQRAALVLFHYQGFTQAEVADAMTISIDAVESLLGRARRGLRTDLADDWQSLLNKDPA